MKIGVIDTGIDVRHAVFQQARIECMTIYKRADGTIVEKHGECVDEKGHGTGIAFVILQMAPEVEILVIKLKAHQGKNTEDLLVTAIAYLVKYDGVKIINISMGVKGEAPSNEMEQVCQEAFRKGITLVAAGYPQAGQKCYPANLPFVFGVKVGKVADNYRFKIADLSSGCVLAKGEYAQVAGPGNCYWMAHGTSFAAATFTGIITRAYLDGQWYCPATLLDWLNSHTDNTIEEAACYY